MVQLVLVLVLVLGLGPAPRGGMWQTNRREGTHTLAEGPMKPKKPDRGTPKPVGYVDDFVVLDVDGDAEGDNVVDVGEDADAVADAVLVVVVVVVDVAVAVVAGGLKAGA